MIERYSIPKLPRVIVEVKIEDGDEWWRTVTGESLYRSDEWRRLKDFGNASVAKNLASGWWVAEHPGLKVSEGL